MDIEVNYRNKKRYNTAKAPLHQNFFWKGLIRILSGIMLTGKKYKVEKINMEGLKPPYMMLSNHMHFIDFELAAMGTWPASVSNVVNIDGYYMMPYLLEWIGAICTRKFTMDLGLIRSIRKVLQRGDVLGMYPEARYSPCGTTSYLPESLGKLIKMNKVPVVVVSLRTVLEFPQEEEGAPAHYADSGSDGGADKSPLRRGNKPCACRSF